MRKLFQEGRNLGRTNATMDILDHCYSPQWINCSNRPRGDQFPLGHMSNGFAVTFQIENQERRVRRADVGSKLKDPFSNLKLRYSHDLIGNLLTPLIGFKASKSRKECGIVEWDAAIVTVNVEYFEAHRFGWDAYLLGSLSHSDQCI